MVGRWVCVGVAASEVWTVLAGTPPGTLADTHYNQHLETHYSVRDGPGPTGASVSAPTSRLVVSDGYRLQI